MKQFNYVITDEAGIHARPAGGLVNKAKEFKSKISIESNGKSSDVTRLITLLGLGIKCGTEVTVSVEGDDEDTAVVEIEKYFKENL